MSPIPLGILALAGAGGAAGAYELIESQVLTSNTGKVIFTSIPTDYKHLQVRIASKTTQSVVRQGINMRLNEVFSSSYAWHGLWGNGSSVISVATISTSEMNFQTAGANSDSFGAHVIDILDYQNTSKNTTVRCFSAIHSTSSTDRQVSLNSGVFLNTSAVTAVEFGGYNFVTGSRFSLYGIRG